MKPVPCFRFALLVFLATGAPGCAAAPTVAEQESPVAFPAAGQIIVKFRDPAFDPVRSDYLAKLSHDFGDTLVYVRPMSGGAHVLCIVDGRDGHALDRIVGLLRARNDVLYAERDRPMRAWGEP